MTATLPKPGTRATVPLLMLAAGVFALLQSLVTPALPQIQQDLDTTASTVTWTLTAYLLAAGIATPVLGRVGDLRGRARILAAVLATLAAGCLLAGFAPTIGVLIAGRVLQGAAGAILPLSFGIIRDTLPPRAAVRSIAGLSSVIGAGGGLGVVLAGPVADTIGYRWLFWIPGAIAAGIAVAVARLLPPDPPRPAGGRVGWLGATLLAGWLLTLLLGVSLAPSAGWDAPFVIALLAASPVLAVLWVVAESRSPVPLVDLTVLRMPAIWPANVAAVLFGAGIFAMFTLTPQLAAAPPGIGLGMSVTGAGLLLLPMLSTVFLAGLVSGLVADRIHPRTQLIGAALIGAAACGQLALWHDTAGSIAVGAGLFGIAAGAGTASMSNLVVAAVPPAQIGAASGMNANLRTIGGAIGTASLTAVVLGDRPAFAAGFAILAGLCLLAAGAAAMLPRGS